MSDEERSGEQSGAGGESAQLVVPERCATGLADREGKMVCEGDIVEFWGSKVYPKVRALVLWEPEAAAFIYQWSFEGGGGGSSLNLADVKECVVVGSKYDDPAELYPAKRAEDWRELKEVLEETR